jgi:hypothetical protein
VKESNLENKNYKQIFEGRLNDMKIYFENILKNVQENNGFNFLSRKIDNIENQIIYQNNNNNRLNNNNNMNGICAVCGNHLHNMMNGNYTNNLNINLNKSNNIKKTDGNKGIIDKNYNINQKNERKEQIDININYNNKKNDVDSFERSKKRSYSSRPYKDSSKLENRTLSHKEESITNTYNININTQNENRNQKPKQNNTLSESTKNEFIINSKKSEPKNSKVKMEYFEEDKKDNNPTNPLKETMKFTNEKTPGEDYNPKERKIKISNNSNDDDGYKNNKLGKNDYIKSSDKTDKKDDDKFMSNNNSNNPPSRASINQSVNDPKEIIDSFYKKYMKRDNKYKGEIGDYKNIDFPKIYKKQEKTINMKITERLGDEENVKPKTIDKFINEYQVYENDIDKKYKNCIFDALGLGNIIEDYKNLMKSKNKSKNSNISNQKNNVSQSLSHNQQSISENKSTSNLKDNNSDIKEKDNNFNNNNKIYNNDQTTMSMIKQNLNQTNNPQTIHQNVTIGYDLANSVNNL